MSLLNRNVYQTEVDLADRLSDMPPQSFWCKWFGGVAVPLAIAVYAISCCARQHAVMVGSWRGTLELNGSTAIAFGLAWLSGAAFLHFHYFWGNLRQLGIFSNPGKVLSLLCLLGSLGYTVWKILERI